jgi:hypothetical protein
MNHRPRLLVLGIALGLSLAFVLPATAGAAGRPDVATAPALPQSAAAQASAQWLARQLTPAGWIPNASDQPSPSFTVNTVLALASAKVDPAGVRSALAYLATDVDSYVTQNGADGPGQLALLILAVDAGGDDPTDFGGTDLVSRLLATEQPSGLFGTEAQVANYAAGNYEQGLALQALGVAGVRGGSRLAAAVHYLVDQQCPDGGWSFTAQATDSCVVSATDYTGPDTNSTAQAVQGLAAQGAVTAGVASGAVGFYAAGQDTDGGWSYYPSSTGAPQSTDPDSTAFVIQALIALGRSPSGPGFVHGSSDPVSALLAFQLTSGPGAGAFESSYAPGSPDLTASFQATPAVAGASFAFALGLSDGAYWLVSSDGGVSALGGAAFHGSMGGQPLDAPIVGLAATPDGGGYWEVASDGGIFAFGDATFHGSMGGRPLNAPIVGVAATSDGDGYWEVASDGGIFAFGDAAFHGSMGGQPLNRPIVGVAATSDGGGYWEVASDGGIFAFGEAAYEGSLPHLGVTVDDIVGIASAPAGGGYWAVASDGGVFAFGTAAFHGSIGGQPLARPVVGMASTPDGGGYWEAAADSGVFAFGTARFSPLLPQNTPSGVVGTDPRSSIVGVAAAGRPFNYTPTA